MPNHTIQQSDFDENLRTMYFEGRNRAYNNQNIMDTRHGLLFQNIKIELLTRSPNRRIHDDRLYNLQTLYYNGRFRNLYDSLGLDLYYGYETGIKKFKSKDMIILELYFHTPNPL